MQCAVGPSASGAQNAAITDFGTADKPSLIAYTRDPEVNALELEQPEPQAAIRTSFSRPRC
ncbi:hypothetical protein CO652_17205 [Rhizobium sp. H4]|nr:hypothetical protein CO652_17205 [Rhizobium sp. H4]